MQTIKLSQNQKKLILCIVSCVVWGLIAHSYMLISSAFSHDSLNAFVADSAENRWKYSIGRFLVPLLRHFFGKISLPWTYGIVSFVIIGCVTYLITELFEIKKIMHILLTSGILIVNLTIIAMVATYLYELPYDMIALLFAVYAAYLMYKRSDFKTKYLLSGLLILLIEGIYQAQVCVIPVIVALITIQELARNNQKINKLLLDIVKYASVLLIATVIYSIINKIVCKIVNVGQTANFDFINGMGMNTVKNAIHAYLKVVRRIIMPFSSLNTILIVLIAVTPVITVVVNLIINMIKNKCGIWNYIMVGLIGLLLPLLMNLFGIINYYSHDLMLYTIFIIYPFILVITDMKIVCISIALLIWNNILVANSCYMEKVLEDKAMNSVMIRVLEDLEKRDDYEIGETKLIFHGYGPFEGRGIDGFEDYNEITGMFLPSPCPYGINWYFDAYGAYLKYDMNYPYNPVDPDYYNDHVDDFDGLDSPMFPNEGYITEYDDGVLIINMGFH